MKLKLFVKDEMRAVDKTDSRRKRPSSTEPLSVCLSVFGGPKLTNLHIL